MSTTPFLSIWSDLACAGGVRLIDTDYVQCDYGASTDGTQGCTIAIPRTEDAVLSQIGLTSVARITDKYGTVSEYTFTNLRDTRTGPLATFTCQSVALRLNNALVRGINRGRPSTVIQDTLSPGDWVNLFAIPSLTAAGQSWWSAGTIAIDVAPTFTLNFTDETVMWLLQQLIQNDPACILPERVGETGYLLHVRPPTASVTPRAWVGQNVTALTREIDAEMLLTVAVPAGATASGNDEPEREWWVPFRAASISGNVVTLDDPSGNGTTILGDDNQWNVPGYEWRLGAVPFTMLVGMNNAGVRTCGPSYSIYRALYVASSSKIWYITGATGVKLLNSMDLLTRTLGSGYTTSITRPTDLAYVSGTDTLYVCDANGNRVTPYTQATATAGTPISVGATPRRLLPVTISGTDSLIVTHTGSNAVKLVSTATNAVTATSPTMTTPGHGDVISATSVYLASNSAASIYHYNPTANTITATITGAQTSGYAAVCYDATNNKVWCFGQATSGGAVAIEIIDPATDTIVETITITGVHGAVVDAFSSGGMVYGVTTDGLYVCYDGATYGNVFLNRPAASGTAQAINLYSVNPLAGLDTVLLGTSYGSLIAVDAQTGGGHVARAITAGSEATPSVTLANSPFPLRQYDEVAFTRSDAMPLHMIPNYDGVETYGPIERQVQSEFLYGDTNRVLNGGLTFFDSSRTTARFLTSVTYDSRVEIKWDGYDDNTVTNFTAQSTTSQSTTAGTVTTLTLKSAGAGRVFLAGDLIHYVSGSLTLIGAQVIAKSAADGSGNVSVLVVGIAGHTWATSDNVPVARPSGTQLLTAADGYVVLVGESALPAKHVTISADIACPYVPGEMTNLYWGIEGFAWGENINPSTCLIAIGGSDTAASILPSTAPNPDTALYQQTLVPMSYTNAIPLPTTFSGGHLQFAIAPPTSGYGALYLSRLWVRIGNADTGAPDDGAWALWQLGQDAGTLRGVPPVTYTVEVLEDDPASPFVVGAAVDLRDAAWGVAASPTIVAMTRPLPRNTDETVKPVLTLESRAPSFVRLVVETMSNQS